MPIELARFFQHVMNFRVEDGRYNVSLSAKTPWALYSRRITSNDLPAEMNVLKAFERAGDHLQYNGQLEEEDSPQTMSRGTIAWD